MRQLLVLMFFMIGILGYAQDDEAFKKGNELYNDGQYAEALEIYQTILDTDQHSAALYYNIANAHYKLNHIAPSIYYYEKALLLNPNDTDIQNNLNFARNMTIDDIDTVPTIGFAKLAKTVTNTFTYDGWATAAVICSILFVICFIAYYFSNKTYKKRFAFIMSVGSLILACAALAFAFHKEAMINRDQPAIVFAEESQIKTEPNLRSEEAFKLHEGTKVQVLDTLENWKQIKLSDGKTGWINQDDIKLLKNF